MRFTLMLIAGLLALKAQAAVPPPVATLDRSTWPEQVNTPALFDVASRAQILMFARALHDSEALDQPAMATRLGLRQINLAAIDTLRQRLWRRLWQNYDLAQQSCEQDASFCFAIDDEDALRRQAAEFEVAADSFYAGWAQAGDTFSQLYLDELLRQAALFPQISSEVERFSDAELTGDELNDRLFLLTFDSGPTALGGSTDALADYLRRQKLSATFFVLGNSLRGRVENTSAADVQALYRGHCVGIQGWQYRSHSQWVAWQDSIMRSVAQAQGDVPDSYVPLFRPPYGQRRADSPAFFASQGLQVMLWNIDSRDDDSRVSAEQAGQRVLSLMLLWRRGIIVFHDTQAKAQAAVPWLFSQTAQSGIGWQDCRDFD
jgi:peptidoglycan/xylan/chitin deacetylase (PgdA/CDA1 family)